MFETSEPPFAVSQFHKKLLNNDSRSPNFEPTVVFRQLETCQSCTIFTTGICHNCSTYLSKIGKTIIIQSLTTPILPTPEQITDYARSLAAKYAIKPIANQYRRQEAQANVDARTSTITHDFQSIIHETRAYQQQPPVPCNRPHLEDHECPKPTIVRLPAPICQEPHLRDHTCPIATTLDHPSTAAPTIASIAPTTKKTYSIKSKRSNRPINSPAPSLKPSSSPALARNQTTSQKVTSHLSSDLDLTDLAVRKTLQKLFECQHKCYRTGSTLYADDCTTIFQNCPIYKTSARKYSPMDLIMTDPARQTQQDPNIPDLDINLDRISDCTTEGCTKNEHLRAFIKPIDPPRSILAPPSDVLTFEVSSKSSITTVDSESWPVPTTLSTTAIPVLSPTVLPFSPTSLSITDSQEIDPTILSPFVNIGSSSSSPSDSFTRQIHIPSFGMITETIRDPPITTIRPQVPPRPTRVRHRAHRYPVLTEDETQAHRETESTPTRRTNNYID